MRTRGELRLITQQLVPAILRAQEEEALHGIADRLAASRLEDAEEILREAGEHLRDVAQEADGCRPSECEESTDEFLSALSCHPTESIPAPSRRATALRSVEVAALEVHVSFAGPYDSATGWPAHQLEWSAETLPLAAVAAGVDPRRVAALVVGAISEVDSEPLEPQSWWRG